MNQLNNGLSNHEALQYAIDLSQGLQPPIERAQALDERGRGFRLLESEYHEVCAISQERFEILARDQMLVRTLCGHKFSAPELVRWLEEKPECPLCRAHVSQRDLACVRLFQNQLQAQRQEVIVPSDDEQIQVLQIKQQAIDLLTTKFAELTGYKDQLVVENVIDERGSFAVDVKFWSSEKIETLFEQDLKITIRLCSTTKKSFIRLEKEKLELFFSKEQAEDILIKLFAV